MADPEAADPKPDPVLANRRTRAQDRELCRFSPRLRPNGPRKPGPG
jgi:hypothetical protein